MPSERTTKTIRFAELTAALCLLLIVAVWFLTSRDFASLVALVTALGAVIALFRRQIPGKEDIAIISVLLVVTGIGLYLIFGIDNCVDLKREIIKCEISEERALKIIYGDDVIKIENGTSPPDTDMSARVILARPYQDGDIHKYVIMTQRLDPLNCPECGPIIDGAVFSEIDDDWYLDWSQMGIAQVVGSGSLPETELILIGPDKFGVQYIYGGTNDGIDYKDAILIAQSGEDFSILFKELISLNNFRLCEADSSIECWGYSATIDMVQGETPAFYDIVVSFDGTIALDENTIIPIDESVIYRYSFGDNRYIKIE